MRPGIARRSAVAVFLLVVAGLAPLLTPTQFVPLLSTALIAATYALGYNLLLGRTGLLSFGHGVYFGLGCFATVHMMQLTEAGSRLLPTPFLPLAGAAAGAMSGLVIGYFSTLRSGTYFAMITFAVGELLYSAAPNLPSWFGGDSGEASMRMPWGGITFGSDLDVYYLVLLWFVVCAGALRFLDATPLALVASGIRENERRLAFLGYNVHRTKVVVFSVSAAVSGIAGGLLGMLNEYAHYDMFRLSSGPVFASVIGGSGYFLGPVLGAILLTAVEHLAAGFSSMWLLYEGLAFIIVMVWFPEGLLGLLALPRGWWRERLGARLLLGVGFTLLAAAVVFLIELGSRVLLPDYVAAAEQTGVWPAVSLGPFKIAPLSIGTWLAPVLLLLAAAGAIVSARRAGRVDRRLA